MLDLNYQYSSQGIVSAIHQKITWIEKFIIHVIGGPDEETNKTTPLTKAITSYIWKWLKRIDLNLYMLLKCAYFFRHASI